MLLTELVAVFKDHQGFIFQRSGCSFCDLDVMRIAEGYQPRLRREAICLVSSSVSCSVYVMMKSVFLHF